MATIWQYYLVFQCIGNKNVYSGIFNQCVILDNIHSHSAKNDLKYWQMIPGVERCFYEDFFDIHVYFDKNLCALHVDVICFMML